MVKRDTTAILNDILEAATDAIDYVENLDPAAFDKLPADDRKTYRAIKNAITEIGEATKSLPSEITDRHPNVDWRGMSGLRDVVAHQYHQLDTERLWPVIKDEFPNLISAVQSELNYTPVTSKKR